MYLHLGQETVVHTSGIVGVFDLDQSSLGVKTREFLAAAEKAGQVRNVSTELPKSFVVTAPDRRARGRRAPQTVFISQIGASTLKKRLELSSKNIIV